MTAVQKIDNPSQEVAEVRDISGGLLDVIARAARDPAVDVEKMERLLEMHDRVQARQAKMAFIEAKRAMRPDLPIITQKGHIVIRDKSNPNKILQDTAFARFEDINEEVMPIVTRHGFDLSFRNATAPDGKVRVYTILTHSDGHSEETYFDLPHDSSGSKNSVQAIGSSTSYAKRYGLLSILNITTMGEDDNGKAADPPKTLTPDQVQKMQARADLKGISAAAVCKLAKADSIPEILAKNFDGIMRELDLAKSRIK